MNYVVFFSPQSNDEIKRIFKSKAFYIGADGKLIDDEEKKARFGKDRKDKNGVVLQEYSSVFARAMMVAAMICEGKIKISDEINKIED